MSAAHHRPERVAGRLLVGLTAPGGPGAPGAPRLGRWLAEGAAARGVLVAAAPRARVRVVVVPAHEGRAARELHAALTGTSWTGRTVALVAYGRRCRRTTAVETVRGTLEVAGARVLPLALGVDVAELRGGPGPAEELREWVLDDLLAAGAGEVPAISP